MASAAFVWLGVQPLQAQDSPTAVEDRSIAASDLLCRLGVNATHGHSGPFEAVDMGQLRVGWYIDYLAPVTPTRPNNIEHAPIIRLNQVGANGYTASPSGTTLQEVIAGNPGVDWIIGNEPDRRQVQDSLDPHVYALAYHDLYHTIKAADPTAQIFAGAIVQPTPLRLQYLDMVLQSYYEQFGHALPADGWAIHNFILNEASCDHYQDLTVCWGAEIPPGIDAIDGLRIEPDQNDSLTLFVEQIQRFRVWMAKRGYWGKPLYVSEYGVLMPDWLGFSPQRVNDFMNATFDYLLTTVDPVYGDPTDGYRVVQRLAWYSTASTEFNGFLYQRSHPNAPFELTAMGQNWVNYVTPLTATADFFPVQITFDPPAPLLEDGAADITIKAVVANSGNTLAAQPLTVRFYDGDPNQGGVLIGTRNTMLTGCGDDRELSISWPNVSPEDRTVFVMVDADGSLNETDEANNLGNARLIFATQHTYLPLVQRSLFLP